MITTFKIEGIKKLKRVTDPKLMKKAIPKTLNDMTKTIKTQTAKEIGQKYTLKAARIKAGIIVKKANKRLFEAIMIFGGRTLSLINFKHKFTQAKKLKSTSKPSQTTVTVKKGQKKRLRGTFQLPGKKPIFARGHYSGSQFIQENTKVSRLAGPSIKGMWRAIGGTKHIANILNSKMQIVFWRNYKFLMDKARGRL